MTDQQDHAERIQEIISEVTKSSTYSAEAMQQFVDLQKAVDEQQSTIKYLRGQNKEKDEALTKEKGEHEKTRDTVGDLNSQLTGYREREQELIGREAKCLELELRAEYNETRVADHKEMVGQIFRNTELKRETFVALPGLRSDDSYGSRTEPYAQPVTETEREE